jgi:RNA polymerase sigma-70 factor (sigma-E family)
MNYQPSEAVAGGRGRYRVRARRRLSELYETHSGWAVRLAYVITQDKELAQDVVQDAFVKVFGRFKDRLPSDEFSAYLRRTVVNLCNDHWRRKRVERRYLSIQRTDETLNDPDLDTRNDIAASLRRLPVRQRTVLVLKHYEGLSEREIADVLQTSVGAIKGLTTRGVANLRQDIGGRHD